MFNLVQKNRKIVQIFLVLITLPFAFFGIESFVNDSGSVDAVAQIGDIKITQPELENALREQQARLRQQFGRDIPQDMLDNPKVRRSVLDSLIMQRVLALHVQKEHLIINDQQLGEAILNVPAFQEEGKFSRALYDAYVASQGLSQQEFERRLRLDISLQQALSAVRLAGVPGHYAANRWIAAMQEVRNVNELVLRPADYLAQVTLAQDAAKTYYDSHHAQFSTPERIRVDYVVLSQQALLDKVSISDAQVSEAYARNADHYRQPEEREARHILITVAADAKEAELAAARQRAEEVLAKLQQDASVANFSALAKEYSQDTGSAAQGGSLGWFARGAMVKPFEEAVFGLQPDQLSGLVRSDFGFHIIRLDGVRGGQVKPLDDAREDIRRELKEQEAARLYAEYAEAFSNMVYEQADSLQPVVDKFALTLQHSGWLTREPLTNQANTEDPLASPKLLAQLFGAETLNEKRNTEALEVAPNTLVSARVVAYEPAALQEFAKVAPAIEQQLRNEEARRLAREAGEARLASLQKDASSSQAWGAARDVSRTSNNLAPEALRAVFAVAANKDGKASFAGAVLADGSYALYRINRSQPWQVTADNLKNEQVRALRQHYERIVAEEDMAAWLANLRLKYPARIKAEKLEPRD